MKKIGLGALILCIGFIFVIMAFTEPDWTMGSRIFAALCGFLFLAVPMLVAHSLFDDWMKEKKASKNDVTSAVRKLKAGDIGNAFGAVWDRDLASPDKPEGKREAFVSEFRKKFLGFFAQSGLAQNTPLQFHTTQIYWHILALQKKRLDARRISMVFETRRNTYNGAVPLSEKSYFDGKYQVSEVNESVSLRQAFYRDNQVLHEKELNRVAHYVITGAEEVGEHRLICPSCGAETTREQLIDGCDYCGTSFTVQDLEDKVSSFRLRDDYEVQYELYKQARAGYSRKVFWWQFGIYFVLICFIYIGMFSDLKESAGNATLAVLFLPLTSALASGMFAYLGMIFFWICIFPSIQVGKSVRFYSKQRLDYMKNRYMQDTEAEKGIRQFDPLFSVAAFYSELSNKLACVHFSDTKVASNAFFEDDRYDFVSGYRDVVDMVVEDINVTDFCVKDGLQQIKVRVMLENLVDRELQLQKQKETVSLTLVKSADCKTQAICGPAVLRCKGCGSSIALERGKACDYCGREIDLKKYDWVIRKYECQ